MCKFYSVSGGVSGADSPINFRPPGLEIAPGIRYKNLHQRLKIVDFGKSMSLKGLNTGVGLSKVQNSLKEKIDLL